MDPANYRECLREAALDEAEGADIMMVKPAGAYLDIIRALKDSTTLPISAYQVSGEYSMLKAASAAGYLNEKDAVLEQLSTKIAQLEEQHASAESEGKAKRAEKLAGLLEELRAKAAAARDVKPIRRSAKFEAEIKQVQQRLAALAKLEESSKKQALPLSETQKLAARPKLMEDLKAMQDESRGWFAE